MSDQDFFFDEDEKPTDKPAAKPASSPAGKASSAKSGTAAPTATGERMVSMTVAALIGVVTLLLGVIVGLFAAPDGNTVPGTNTQTQQGGTAPQLTDEQIQGGLPANHPDISGVAPTTSTGEATTAPTE